MNRKVVKVASSAAQKLRALAQKKRRLSSVTAGYGKHCSNAQEGCIAKRGRFGGKHSKTSTETAGSCETVLRGFESQSKRSSVHQEMGARVYLNENEKSEAL